ncbi:MAG: hypothetical protein WAV13_12295, partial [Thermodesulfovibrionales bacterium]
FINNYPTLKHDNTIGYKGKLYQLLEHIGIKRITVRENLDGTMQLLGNGGNLKYKEITERPKKIEPQKVDRPKYKHPPQPASHPWRKYYDKEKLIPKRRIYANL